MNVTAKEKAKELVDKFRLNVLDYEGSGLNNHKAKQCALIAVNEILETLTEIDYGLQYLNLRDYWEEVKQEIDMM